MYFFYKLKSFEVLDYSKLYNHWERSRLIYHAQKDSFFRCLLRQYLLKVQLIIILLFYNKESCQQIYQRSYVAFL